jgi:predicted amidohydrolase
MTLKPLKVAAIQPAFRRAAVEENLGRLEDLIRDAHREHDPRVIIVPEAMTSPNVYHRDMRGVARPVDGAPFQLLTRLSRELDCLVGGGFLARRGNDTYGTYVLAEPDGSAHLHDKDIPSAWENHYYRAGDDDGKFHSAGLGIDVGLASGWEWARYRTSKRLRGVDLMLGGMCWPSFPNNWPGPLRWWANREDQIWKRQNRELPRQVARLVGAPVVYAAHVGPIEAEFPLTPIPWKTTCLGETQIVEADGTVRARLSEADGEGHIGAEIIPGAVAPLDPLADRFWIPVMTASTHVAAWHAMNNIGRADYRIRKLLGKHEWQALPGGDLPDELPATEPERAHFATSA